MIGHARLLSLKEAADYLGVHRNTMLIYLKKAAVRGRKIGGVWKINRAELERCGRANYQVKD